MKKYIIAIFLFIAFINANLTQNNPLSKSELESFKEKYARPISEWEKPHIDSNVEWQEFTPLPTIDEIKANAPKDNIYTKSKVALGKKLFNDVKLSKSKQISCATCHKEVLAFGDGITKAIGHNGASGNRNTQNIQVSALLENLFWDGRADSLESQVLFPLTNIKEMANTPQNAQDSIKQDSTYYAMFIESFGTPSQVKKWKDKYPQLFITKEQMLQDLALSEYQKAQVLDRSTLAQIPIKGFSESNKDDLRSQIDSIFGNIEFYEPLESIESKLPNFTKEEIKEAKKLINIENIAKAIATYERSLIPQNTRFNHFLKGEYDVLDDVEIYGLHIFRTKARCMNCHYGATLSDSKFHNLNLSFVGRKWQDLGRYEITKDSKDLGSFRTPTLINIAKSTPYFHNGISPNLIGVIHFYDIGFAMPIIKGSENSPLLGQKSPLIKRLQLTTQEILALEAFLKTL